MTNLEIQNKNYKDYVNEHIKNVKRVWKNASEFFKNDNLVNANMRKISTLIDIHDRSKYDPMEFEGYRQFFYPEDGKQPSKEIFNKAWEHHYKNNPHHWDYWIFNGKPTDMDIPHIFEMLSDWGAMSLKFNNLPSKYFEANSDKIIITPKTKKIVTDYLPIFNVVVLYLKN